MLMCFCFFNNKIKINVRCFKKIQNYNKQTGENFGEGIFRETDNIIARKEILVIVSNGDYLF
jgi:hypothetical protein